VKKALIAGLLVSAVSIGFAVKSSANDDWDHFRRFEFQPGTLVLSRSLYEGTASTVTIGQTLPPGCVATTVVLPTTTTPAGTTNVSVACGKASDNGEYPNLSDTHNVWNNDGPDGSFGVTSPIFLDNITTDGHLIDTLAIPSDQIVTSFSSKSELALNRSLDKKSITFVGYRGGTGFVTGPNQLDVSNSNTPGVIDPSNPVVSQYYRSVAEVDADGHIQITEGNAYSGNNGRAAIKADSLYYLTGNDNNGGLSSKSEKPVQTGLTDTQVGINLVTSTGAELLVPGQAPPVPPFINMIGDFAVTSVGYTTADKPGKDNNFRGLTIFNHTMYVTKGSGGNGINTVYQVGNAGQLPSGSTAALEALPITILPGFPTSLASGVDQNNKPAPVMFPFGIWFANSNTLYVCDEGDGTLLKTPVNGNVADASALATAGVQKWVLSNGTWKMVYVLQNGLNIGVPYGVTNYPAALSPATDGCRNITGRHNGDGTVTIYAVTSTISTNGDQGADPNKLVKVTDVLNATTLPTGDGDHDRDDSWEKFVTIRTAQAGEVLRGVSFAPVDRDFDDRDGWDDHQEPNSRR
jgi:hypothetical protein